MRRSLRRRRMTGSRGSGWTPQRGFCRNFDYCFPKTCVGIKRGTLTVVVSKRAISLKANINFPKPAAPNAGLLNEVVLLQHWQNYSQRAEGGWPAGNEMGGGRRRLLPPSRRGGAGACLVRHSQTHPASRGDNDIFTVGKNHWGSRALLGLAQRGPNLASFGAIQPPLWVSMILVPSSTNCCVSWPDEHNPFQV